MSVLLRGYYCLHDGLFNRLQALAFIAPLLMRLYLAPVMLAAGLYKAHHIDAVIQWFEHGLGFPEPVVLAYAVAYIELIGGFCLLFGLAVRWLAMPLMVVMLVAAGSVHWQNGWFTVAPSEPLTSVARPLADIGVPAAKQSLENSVDVAKRLHRAEALLMEHGNYAWLTEKGEFAVLNNGIEKAATYFIMLLALLFSGAGRYLSFDAYLDKRSRAIVAAAVVVPDPEVDIPVVESAPGSLPGDE